MNQDHTNRSPLLSKEERKDWHGTSKNCSRRYLDTVEEDYQEEARKRKVGKEGEEGEGREQRQEKNEIIEEVI